MKKTFDDNFTVTCKCRGTVAGVVIHQVNTRRVILTSVRLTVVNIGLTAITFKARRTRATVQQTLIY